MTPRLAALVMVGAMAVMSPAHGAGAEGPSATYSPHRGPPGTVITLSGTCPHGFRPEYATFRIARQVNDGEQPFDHSENYPVDPATDSFSGTFRVPNDAPYDGYTVTFDCSEDDMLLHVAQGDFLVAAADVTTTTNNTGPTATMTTTSQRPPANSQTTTSSTAPSTTTTTAVESSTTSTSGSDEVASGDDAGGGGGSIWPWVGGLALVGATAAGVIVRRRPL